MSRSMSPTSTMSFSSKVRLLFRTQMLPEDPTKAVVEVQLEDFSNSPKQSHSRTSSRSSLSSIASDFSVPSFMPSAVAARQASQGSMTTHYERDGSYFGFEEPSSPSSA